MAFSRSSYDVISYQGLVVPNTSPSHLAICSLWHHGICPPFKQYHLTELGCGDGTNLLALAFYNSKSTFIGIDNSKVELDLAREVARYLGLENIKLVLKDVRDLGPTDLEPSDYVIGHGLYSWVSKDARKAILNFCRQNLKPTGLAYISYNANPGWAIRRLVRETLMRSRSVREATIEEKAIKAIEMATELLEDLPSREYASAVLLAEELERVRNSTPGYVFHEYLTEVNEGFWLLDFVKHALRQGLNYVTDAQFCRWEGHVPSGLRATLSRRDLNSIEQEEVADLLGDRYFRASILCRADAVRTTATLPDLLEKVYFATSLHAKSDPFDLAEGLEERFNGIGLIRGNEPEVTLNAAITKAATVLLAAQWPKGMRFETLYGKALKLLCNHGLERTKSARSKLSDDLTALFEAGQIDLRLEEPVFFNEISDYPKAHALARFEADHRETLTTPYHLPIPFDSQALMLVRVLDGTRSQKSLGRIFGQKLVDGTLGVLGRWGLLAS